MLVFVFFGLVATAGSAYVQHAAIPSPRLCQFPPWAFAIWASVPVGLLATALLQANNLRDVETDKETGKKTLAVRLGRTRAGYLYVATLVAAAASIGVLQHYRGWALMALAALPLGRPPGTARPERSATGERSCRCWPATARLQLAVGVLLTVGLLLVRP